MKNIKFYIRTTIATSSFLLIGFSSLYAMEQIETLREMQREEKLEAARAQHIKNFCRSRENIKTSIKKDFILINRDFMTNLKEFTDSFAQISSDPELRCYHDQALRAATILFTFLADYSEQGKFRCELYRDKNGKFIASYGVFVNALLVEFVVALNKTGDPVLIELAKTIGKINFI